MFNPGGIVAKFVTIIGQAEIQDLSVSQNGFCLRKWQYIGDAVEAQKAMSDFPANILIVDDQLENLRVLSTLLTQQGYQVRKARSGQMALETVKVVLPDLILLDIRMPNMNGYEVCGYLKATPETCEIPVVFLSALDDPNDKVKGFEVGGIDYITKPFQLQEVLLRIENQLTIQSQKRKLIEQNQKLQQEIQERQRVEAEIRLLLKITKSMSEAWDFETALEVALHEICRVTKWEYGEAWMPQQNQMILKASQRINQDDQLIKQFSIESRDLKFTSGLGLIGLIFRSQKSEWIVDCSQETPDKFLRSEAAKSAGLKTVLGVPMILGNRVWGVLVFFKKVAVLPDERLIQLVSAVAVQLGALMPHKKAEEALRIAYFELERLARLDGLTQVANRRYFDESLEREWRRLAREKQPLSLILCDVDCFKRYNDHYGHQAGDQVLREIAQALCRSTKRPADFVGRYGGEEFVVILPNTHLAGAMQLAELIRTEVEKLKIRHETSTVQPYLTISLGVASVIPKHKTSACTLLNMADNALYEAKKNGRNQAISCPL